MMRISFGLALAAMLAAAPAPLLAQQQSAPQPRSEAAPRQHAMQRPALGFLLRHRAELELTDRQINRLEEIVQRLEQQNQPLLQQLREAGIPVRRERREGVKQMTPEQRRELRQRMEAQRPTLMQLRENATAAMEEARGVLSAEQQEKLREIMRQRTAAHPRERPPHPSRGS